MRRLLESATAALLLSSVAAQAGAPDWSHVDPRIAPALRGVLEQAAERLADPRCSAILSSHVDGRTGRPIAETLSRAGVGAGEWMRLVYFTSGEGQRTCADAGTLAWTPVGSPVVFVCPASFGKCRREAPDFATTVLIHEVLHTLGLGENPPSPREITATVQRRCGR